MPSPAKHRIVILGGGFAGAYCAAELEQRTRDLDVEIVLLDRHNYFIFYPLLIEAGTGTLQPKHAVVPIRMFLRTPRAKFIMGDVTSADLQKQEVRYRLINGDEGTLHYDHLVLAIGSVSNLPPIPGLKEHAYEMKSLAHAISLRDRAIQMLELANALGGGEACKPLLHFIVVGANYTGVEAAGEFDEYMKDASRKYPNIKPSDVKITIIEREKRILTTVDDASAQWAADHLRRRGINLVLGDTTARIDVDGVDLKSGGRLNARTVIWCAGIAPPPLLKQMNVPLDAKGWMVCHPDFRVKGFHNIWGVGDCAVNPAPDGRAYPPTAQLAILEGKHAAKNIASVLHGRATTNPHFRSRGMLAAFGRFDAVANLFGFRLTGFPAWFLWRSAYLLKMPGIGRKFRVAFDWTLDLFFGRDYVELGVHAPTVSAAASASARAPARNESPPSAAERANSVVTNAAQDR